MEDTQSLNEGEVDAVIVSAKEQTSAKDWRMILKAAVPDFKGNIDNAAVLMHSLQKGVDYMYSKFRARGLDTIYPKFAFVTHLPVDIGVTDSPEGVVICVTQPMLEASSNLSTDQFATNKHSGVVSFRGTVAQSFELAGVEEGHHVFFVNTKGREKYQESNTVNLAEYDAQDIEYRALSWKLRYANEKGMLPVTTGVIKERLEAAKDIRKKNLKSSTVDVE